MKNNIIKIDPLGVRNRNPLNIRATESEWIGQVGKNKGFVKFKTFVHGYRAAFRIMNVYNKNYNLTSVGRIIQRWAPESENNTCAYIKRVCELTGLDPYTRIVVSDQDSTTDVCNFVRAMASVETGVPYNEILHLTILAGLDLSRLNAWEVIPDRWQKDLDLPFYKKDYVEPKEDKVCEL